MIYAIDFDGTLVNSQYPYIGEERKLSTHMLDKTGIEKFIPATDFCKELQRKGHKLILWTCREGEPLQEALRWCLYRGLIFDAVNDDLPQVKQCFPDALKSWEGSKRARKIHADVYIDDKAVVPICEDKDKNVRYREF